MILSAPSWCGQRRSGTGHAEGHKFSFPVGEPQLFSQLESDRRGWPDKALGSLYGMLRVCRLHSFVMRFSGAILADGSLPLMIAYNI